MSDKKPQDIVRVLRIIEYVGPRDIVEKTVAQSIHGTKTVPSRDGDRLVIRAATIGTFPEILDKDDPVAASAQGRLFSEEP